MIADGYVWSRDHSTPLEEVLAKIDEVEREGTNPRGREIAAKFRHLARVVYANPTWTRRDAWLYGEQECWRASPR